MPADRILIVDDEEAIREIVSSMLVAANYQCRQAGSGLEALAILNSGEEFELMLSDLMMAELDGIGLLERTKEKYPEMPVVMVTAVHDISVALAAIRNGAYDYLLKPFEREQLLATVRRALENRRLKVENRTYQTNLEALVSARTEQLRKAVSNLEKSYDITLEALGDALDLKDAETEGHSKRVTTFTIAIAKHMGMAADQIRVIARGGQAHARRSRRHAGALLSRVPDAAQDSFPRRSRRDRVLPPGALRRHRLSARLEGRGNPSRGPHVLDCRHPGRHNLRPPLSCGTVPGGRAGRNPALVRQAI